MLLSIREVIFHFQRQELISHGKLISHREYVLRAGLCCTLAFSCQRGCDLPSRGLGNPRDLFFFVFLFTTNMFISIMWWYKHANGELENNKCHSCSDSIYIMLLRNNACHKIKMFHETCAWPRRAGDLGHYWDWRNKKCEVVTM